ncbi:MAG: DNA recombination protein RmuC [Holosporales bacterium]|jgi:DNA recombination protein RmuC|nr:DNA recombination protein RmuC [Holosporales bacterium]
MGSIVSWGLGIACCALSVQLWRVGRARALLALENVRLEERCAYNQQEQEQVRALEVALAEERSRLIVTQVELKEERQKTTERMQLLTETETRFQQVFKALSADALSSNAQSFLTLAQEVLSRFQEGAKNDLTTREKTIEALVAPIKTALETVAGHVQALEKARVGAYEGLKQQLSDLALTQCSLKTETTRLVSALKTPNVRGRWGEMQLKRVVELSGMIPHCDFEEQVVIDGEEETVLRPDMIVHLPGNRRIAVDAKAPLASYLAALETPQEEQRKVFLKEHARHVRQHIAALASKKYWQYLQPSPDFVVLFLPGEPFFSAALECIPDLIEIGMRERVILATPTTLLALLHGVAAGWRQESLAENARYIADLGRELYKRLGDVGEHMLRLGRALAGATEAYNQSVSTLERRVLVSARRFKDLAGTAGIKDLPEIAEISVLPKIVEAPECLIRKDCSEHAPN